MTMAKNRLTPDLYEDMISLQKELTKLAKELEKEKDDNDTFSQYVIADFTAKTIRSCLVLLKGDAE
jgi:hypothetical protein